MPTRFTSLGVKGPLTVAGLLTAGVVALTTVTGTTGTFTQLNYTTGSGGSLDISRPTQGSGKILIDGSSGAYLCLQDSDHAGYTLVQALNGTVTGKTAGAGMCP